MRERERGRQGRSRRRGDGRLASLDSYNGYRFVRERSPLAWDRGQRQNREILLAAKNYYDDEGEWQFVRRRRHDGGKIFRSESQNSSDQHRLRSRVQSRVLAKGRVGAAQNRRDRFFTHGNSVPSRPAARELSGRKIYFEDFPNGIDSESLKRIFGRFGIHGWVYVARKRNLRNLNFGFLTIDGNTSIADVITKLNDIKIGPASLKASRARYTAPKIFAAPQPKVTTSKSKKEYHDSKRDHRSFSDVVANKEQNTDSHEVSITKNAAPLRSGDSYETSMAVQPAIWKARACRVRLSNISMIRNIYDVLTEHGFQVDFAAPCGDDNVIIAFETIDSLRNFMSDEWTTLNHVITSVEPIDSDYVSRDCLVYVDLMGIPPVFICEEVVRDLAARYGKVVAVDSDLARPDRLDVVSCLVSVPMGTEVKQISVTLRNKEFNIFSAIRQGVGCDRCNNQDDEHTSEDESGSAESIDSESDHEAGGCMAPVRADSDGVVAEKKSSDENANNSASSNSGSRNNLIIREEEVGQVGNEDMLTFSVGKTLGLFHEQDSREIMALLEGKR